MNFVEKVANYDFKELFDTLIQVEDEDEVVKILDVAGFPLSNRAVWRPLGNNPGNFSTVCNQADSPSGALVEKFINCIDAVLMSECHGANIDPESDEAPKTMSEAVEKFMGVKNGRLDYLSATEQTELADNIHLVAVGKKTAPSYLIIDRGEGQTPYNFPSSFLSTSQSSPKIKVNFVQGKFNAGGSGILQFCGKHNIQLIVSKRQPHAPVEKDDFTRELWGFTIVRRRRPVGGGVRTSVFEYLAPDGKVPSFSAPGIKVLPGQSKKNKPPEPYAEELNYGTCIKLYNYKWSSKSIATTEARREVEGIIQAPCLPFRITETRSYRANMYATTVIGIWNNIQVDASKEDNGKLEAGFPATAEVNVEGIGVLPVQICVWKEDVDSTKLPTGIYYLLNGQVHEGYKKDYISRNLDFGYLEDDLLVSVECNYIDAGAWEDISMGARDRFRKIDETKAIKKAITEELKDHPGLKQLNARRRQERREKANEDTSAVNSIFEELVKKDPGLATFFNLGGSLLTGTGPGISPKFVGSRFPTIFKLLKCPKDGLQKKCPINSTVKIEFETDAENNYFRRPDDHGELSVYPSLDIIESSHLWNGIFTVKFRVPWNANVGDEVKVKLEVSDINAVMPFVSEFTLLADKKVDKKSPSGKANPRVNPKSEQNNSTMKNFEPPIPIEVSRKEWGKHGILKQSEAIKIKPAPAGEGYDFYINIDNSTLVTESSNKKHDPLVLKFWFKWGLTLSALGMIREQEEENSIEDGEKVAPDLKKIEHSINGLSRVIIPVIRSLYNGPEA